MIYATGFVTIIANANTKPLRHFKCETLSLEMMEEEKNEVSLKIKYRYTAFLPRSYECQSLEDYTGKIKPFIENQFQNIIVSLQVTHLNYVSNQAVRRMKK